MDRDVDEVVPAREGLVDGVVDDLVDEVVETAGAGRADVHAGPQPDRLEAFQDRDVLCGVIRLGHAAQITSLNKKSPANRAFRGILQCIRNGGRKRPGRGSRRRRGRSSRGAPRRSIAAVSCSARRRVSVVDRGGAGETAAASGAGGDGTGPGRELSAVGAPSPTAAASFARISSARRPSSKAQADDVVATSSVPSRAMRCGPGRARDRVADRGRPGARHLGERAGVRDAGAPQRAADACRRAAPSRHLHRGRASRAGAGPARAGAPRRPSRSRSSGPRAPILSLRIRRRRSVELRERVVEEQQRRHAAAGGDQLGLGEQEREHARAAAPPASRTCAGRGRAERIAISSRCGPERPSCRARCRASSRSSSEADRRRLARRSPATTPSRPSSAARSAKPRLQQLERRRGGRPSSIGAEVGDLRRPRRQHVARRRAPCATRRSAALRWPTAARVVERDVRAGRIEPAERAVEVRPPGGGPALDDARGGRA